MPGILVLFLSTLLLHLITGQVNHTLAAWQLHVFAGGLAVTFAGLHFPRGAGLIAVILAGLLADAASPLAFGTQATLFGAAFLAVQQVRDRVPTDLVWPRVGVALLANGGIFLGLTLLYTGNFPSVGRAWGRLTWDFLCSEALIALIGPWFLELQARALQWVRFDHLRLR
jgi:cell shape-determining protein MreD